MLKRIHIQHLTLGMYLHEFCGSWMDHPFWRVKFLLKDPKDLARIQAQLDLAARQEQRYAQLAAQQNIARAQYEQLRADLVYRLRINVTDPDDRLRQGQPVTVRLQQSPDPGAGQ